MKTKAKKKDALVDSLYRQYFSNVSVDIMDLSKVSAEIGTVLATLPQPPDLKNGMEHIDGEMKKIVAKYRKN